MAKPTLPPVEDERVRLRLLEQRDLPLTLAWRNQDHIRRWFFYSAVITPEQHAAWFESYRNRDDDFVFIIEEAASHGRPVGQVALYHIDRAAGRAEFGRLMIGPPDAAGKGLAFAATRLAVKIAFNLLGLGEVFLEVLPNNRRAIDLYRAAGFQPTLADPEKIVMNVMAPLSESQ